MVKASVAQSNSSLFKVSASGVVKESLQLLKKTSKSAICVTTHRTAQVLCWRMWIKAGGKILLKTNEHGDSHFHITSVGDSGLISVKMDNSVPPLQCGMAVGGQCLVPTGAKCILYNSSKKGIASLRGISVLRS
eukprot:GHVR01134871.1.p1 GENE.GHVR01134871.1~~GHVR01134871.1.p1  ORF type:complete len:145 (+),score=14.87 GHVR01134871.1:34-435(+)